jgi:hypothetical protein
MLRKDYAAMFAVFLAPFVFLFLTLWWLVF